MTDHEKLCAAISIVQQHICALDTNLIPDKMFRSYMPSPALEVALNLMMDALNGAQD